jgi:hypothetical protein
MVGSKWPSNSILYVEIKNDREIPVTFVGEQLVQQHTAQAAEKKERDYATTTHSIRVGGRGLWPIGDRRVA